MSKHSLRSWWLIAVLLVAWTAPQATAARAASLLPADAGKVIDLLPPPPADDSVAGRADLETVLQVQADRTESQIERAKHVVHHTPFDMGARVFGPWFTKEELPRTAAVFKDVVKQCQPLFVEAKARWQRARPYVRDARVKPCVELPRHTSYPSGHSSSSALWAAVFQAAFPERKAEFEAAAHETMWCRVIAGVHYPTDTQAGYILGTELGRKLLTTPAMQEAIGVIREEVNARARSVPDNAAAETRRESTLTTP